MIRAIHGLSRGLMAVALLALPAAALAGHEDDPSTNNVHDMGHDVAPASLFNGPPFDIHTDLAFWGDLAIQGNWNGFRILDISEPDNPVLLNFVRCEGRSSCLESLSTAECATGYGRREIGFGITR